eukprot:9399101-Alexandrium_andersonii.AAC.1
MHKHLSEYLHLCWPLAMQEPTLALDGARKGTPLAAEVRWASWARGAERVAQGSDVALRKDA